MALLFLKERSCGRRERKQCILQERVALKVGFLYCSLHSFPLIWNMLVYEILLVTRMVSSQWRVVGCSRKSWKSQRSKSPGLGQLSFSNNRSALNLSFFNSLISKLPFYLLWDSGQKQWLLVFWVNEQFSYHFLRLHVFIVSRKHLLSYANALKVSTSCNWGFGTIL